MADAQNHDRRAVDANMSEMREAIHTLLDHEKAEKTHWKFERRISVGNLLTAGGILLLLFGAWATMDKRVLIIERSVEYQSKIDDRQDRNAEIARSEVKTELEKINLKLDRVIESGRSDAQFPRASPSGR